MLTIIQHALSFDIINCNFKKLFSASDHSIDKTMIPYFGDMEPNSSHAASQFVLASSCGALLQLTDTHLTLNHTVELTLSCQSQALAKVLMQRWVSQKKVVCRVVSLLPLTSSSCRGDSSEGFQIQQPIINNFL